MRGIPAIFSMFACLATVSSVGGCSGKTPLQKLNVGPLVPVQGKVTLGNKPLMGGNVFFYPEGDKKDYVPQGFIDSEGNYKMKTSGEPGAPAGKYRVTVDPASDDNRQNLQVDTRYSSFEKTPLTITVTEKAPAGSYDLKLPIRQ